SGLVVRANEVVCTLALPAAYTTLIPPGKRKTYTNEKINSLEYGCSAFMMYMGVKKDYSQLLHHNVFFAQDYLKNFEEIFSQKVLPTSPSVYLNVPTRTNPKLAPKGKHLLYVLVPVPHQGKQAPLDWEKEKDAFVERVLNQMEANGLTNIRENVEMLEVFTPSDWEKLGGMHLGSTFGLSPKFLQSSVFRPSQRSEEFAHLYFVGAGTHPGSGMPMVLISARTCEKMMGI
ncbi:MAG: FAD-dependent oxidoreductase, partial [archaeon]